MSDTVRRLPRDPVITRSREWAARAEGLIPALTQTLAKGPGQHVRGFAPMYLQHGKGCRVTDVDGNEYIDLTMAVGPLALGYGWPAVDDAIRAQLEDGIVFSLMHPLEVEVAELVREVVPGAEAVRFSKTGVDVTSAAVRLARAYTGRDRVLCCGYHGWHDWYISVTDRNRGIPAPVQDLTTTVPYNDLAAVESRLDADVACVILEPMVFEAPKPGFLAALKELCRDRGALLIFDEMWTGFRMALGGAQEHFGVAADLACFSKAVANGMPLSLLTGRADVMQLLDKDVFFFTTFGGEALSLAAAKATIGELRRHDVAAHLHRKGKVLQEGYNLIAADLGLTFTKCVGLPHRTLITFDAAAVDPLLARSYVQQELLRRGVLWNGFHNVSFSHGDADLQLILSAYREALALLGDAIVAGDLRERIRGTPVEPVFRRTSNFDMRPSRREVVR